MGDMGCIVRITVVVALAAVPSKDKHLEGTTKSQDAAREAAGTSGQTSQILT